MKKIFVVCVIAILLIINVFQFIWNYPRFQGNAVPDEEAAIAIARVILDSQLEPIYIQSVGYFDWVLDVTFDRFRSSWIVTTGLPADFPEGVIIMWRSVEVVIRMRDARIISIRG